MDYSDLFKSGLGAMLGFALAQVLNIAKLVYDSIVQPRLRIEKVGGAWRVLSHSTEAAHGALYKEEIFSFSVRNVGRRVATGVRCQLLKIEYRRKEWPEFADVKESAADLRTYAEGGGGEGDLVTTLIPQACAQFQVAAWREDYPVLFPSIDRTPAYYEEICSGAVEYRFTVVAIDDQARFVTEQLTIAMPN